jgi:putative oxidoreductase
MTSISHPNNHMTFHLAETKAKLWAVPVGRFFFSLIFIMSGVNHFSAGTIAYAAEQGVPMANILVPLSGLLALFGGISILLGYFARFGAMLLILFLVPVTLTMHNFWDISDPAIHQMQMIQFMKNLTILGGVILIAFYGAGPKSIDLKRPRRNTP